MIVVVFSEENRYFYRYEVIKKTYCSSNKYATLFDMYKETKRDLSYYHIFSDAPLYQETVYFYRENDHNNVHFF